jgi:predicted nucleic acid-binding protein
VRYGLDTNVLIYAHLPVFAESEQVREYLRRGLLADDRRRFSLTALVLRPAP